MSALVLATALVGSLLGILLALIFWPSPPEQRVTPVRLLPYIGISFLCYTAVFIVATVAKLHAPATFGLAGIILCIGVPGSLIVREHRRPLLGVEASWLAIAACLSVSFYGYLLKILLKVSRGEHWTADELELTLIGAIVDFVTIWIAALCVFFLARLLARSMAPPNNRWRGP